MIRALSFAVRLFLLALPLTACGISLEAGPARPIELSVLERSGLANLQLVSRDEKTIVYRFDQTGRISSPGPIFLSALTSCSVEEGEKLPAISRKLFVGLDHFLIRAREQRELGDQTVFTMVSTAQLENQPLALGVISAVHKQCATDLALWCAAPEAKEGIAAVTRARDELLAILGADRGRLLKELQD